MPNPDVAIIMSTTREGRFCDKPAAWIHEIASARGDMNLEVVDLRDFPMPYFDEPASNAFVPSRNEVAQRWQKAIARFDAYIFVVAEYNRGLPGVLKNALDYAYTGWNRKPFACVGYGSVGGARSIEQLRTNGIELQMAPTRTGVHIQGGDFFDALLKGRDLKTLPYIEQNATAMLDELLWWTAALKTARAATPS